MLSLLLVTASVLPQSTVTQKKMVRVKPIDSQIKIFLHLFALVTYLSVISSLITLVFFSVPSAPADIKAAVSTRNKILVSWLPPANPNGVLVGYTLYMSVIEDGREVCDFVTINSD